MIIATFLFSILPSAGLSTISIVQDTPRIFCKFFFTIKKSLSPLIGMFEISKTWGGSSDSIELYELPVEDFSLLEPYSYSSEIEGAKIGAILT